MGKILVKSVATNILVKTDSTYVKDLLFSLYPARIIPEYESKEYEDENFDCIVEFLLGKPSFEPKHGCYNTIKKYKITSEKQSVGEPAFILLQILERSLEEKKLYMIEASSVSKNEKGILIFGKRRSGKTVLSLELFNEGFNYISNEATVVDPLENKILGGSKVPNLKNLDVKYFKMFKNCIAEQKTDDVNYNTYLLDLRNSERVRKRAEISLIIEPLIYPSKVEKGFVTELPNMCTKYYLLEYPTQIIRGVHSLINKFEINTPSLDNILLNAERNRRFIKGFKNVKSYSVAGDKEFVKNKVIELFEDEV